MILADLFKEFIESLHANDVEYILVGGHAVAAYGHVRNTGDMDIWIRVSEENSHKVVQAIQDFGLGSLGVRAEFFQKEGEMIQMGYPPFRIDVLTSIDGVTFDEAYADRIRYDYEGFLINVIHLNHLRRNKQASGRLKDLADLDDLPTSIP